MPLHQPQGQTLYCLSPGGETPAACAHSFPGCRQATEGRLSLPAPGRAGPTGLCRLHLGPCQGSGLLNLTISFAAAQTASSQTEARRLGLSPAPTCGRFLLGMVTGSRTEVEQPEPRPLLGAGGGIRGVEKQSSCPLARLGPRSCGPLRTQGPPAVRAWIRRRPQSGWGWQFNQALCRPPSIQSHSLLALQRGKGGA